MALSIYMASIGMSPALIGAVLGASALFSAAGSLAVGYLADYADRLRLFVLLSLAEGASLLLMAFRSPVVVSAAYLLFMFLNRYPVWAAVMGEFARRRGASDELFSISSALNVAFSVLGAAIASLPSYLGQLGYDVLFAAEASAVLISAASAYSAIKRLGLASIGAERVGLRDLLRLRSSWLLKRLLPDALIGLGAGLIIPLFSLWFYLKFHVSLASLSVVYAASNATLALGILAAPVVSRALGSRVLSVTVLQGTATAILAVMPEVPNLPAVLALFVVRNTLMNMANPLLTSLINDLTPKEERGRVFGAWNTLSSVPRAVGPAVGGYLMGAGYLDLPLYITASLYATAVASFYVLLRGVEGSLQAGG